MPFNKGQIVKHVGNDRIVELLSAQELEMMTWHPIPTEVEFFVGILFKEIAKPFKYRVRMWNNFAHQEMGMLEEELEAL